ncbi:MAG: hypothetical protein ACI823_001869 [Chitinophagales bacterium]|jgi:hypothetical protein
MSAGNDKLESIQPTASFLNSIEVSLGVLLGWSPVDFIKLPWLFSQILATVKSTICLYQIFYHVLQAIYNPHLRASLWITQRRENFSLLFLSEIFPKPLHPLDTSVYAAA